MPQKHRLIQLIVQTYKWIPQAVLVGNTELADFYIRIVFPWIPHIYDYMLEQEFV